MAKRKNKTKSKSGGFSLFVYLIIVILLLGIVGAVALNLYNDYVAYSGVYLVYKNENYTADSSGMSCPCFKSYTFTIDNTDWGIYSVTDCTVKVISNVSDSKVFEFHIDDENYRYTSDMDLSAAFADDYDGNSIKINEDGTFTINFYLSETLDNSYMTEVLNRVYNTDSVIIDTELDVSTYPYFAIQIISPDGTQTVTIPFVLYWYSVTITPQHIYF